MWSKLSVAPEFSEHAPTSVRSAMDESAKLVAIRVLYDHTEVLKHSLTNYVISIQAVSIVYKSPAKDRIGSSSGEIYNVKCIYLLLRSQVFLIARMSLALQLTLRPAPYRGKRRKARVRCVLLTPHISRDTSTAC